MKSGRYICVHGLYSKCDIKSAEQYYSAWDLRIQKDLHMDESTYVVFVIDMSSYEDSIKAFDTFIRTVTTTDVVVLNSLADISPIATVALQYLEKLYKRDIPVYILSQPVQTYAEARDILKATVSSIHGTTKKAVVRAQSETLMEYAMSLRTQSPQVSYREIEKHTGVPKATLISYMQRVLGELPEATGNRKLTEDEIAYIGQLKEKVWEEEQANVLLPDQSPTVRKMRQFLNEAEILLLSTGQKAVFDAHYKDKVFKIKLKSSTDDTPAEVLLQNNTEDEVTSQSFTLQEFIEQVKK